MRKRSLLLSLSLVLTCHGSVFGQTTAFPPSPGISDSSEPAAASSGPVPIFSRSEWGAVPLEPLSRGLATIAAVQAAGDTGKGRSAYDKIWKSFTEFYKDESNPIVQSVLFTGRYQYDFAWLDADQGHHTEWNVRRLRLGPKMTLFHKVVFHSEIELNPQEHDPLYMRFTDFYVQWNRSKRTVLTVGKQAVPFTNEGATSSKDLLTIDRSNLNNNIWFTEEYLPGVSVSGTSAPWVYRAGVYSGGAKNREFGEFTGDLSTLGVVGYDFAKSLKVKEALLVGNYVYQHPDPQNTFTRPLEHIFSLNFKFEADGWGFRSDLSKAAGYLGQSDLWGVMAMPFYNFTDKFQFVGRYVFLESERPNGVRLGTYENRIVAGRGDRYKEGYLGANYYFYGHKLKVQTGVQFADLRDRANDGGAYSGTSWVTGLRVGW